MSSSGKYEVHNQPVEVILGWIKSGEIAIPEIQRPFVWDTSKVRDLMDSLYQGFPVGYLITWKSEGVNIKDGTASLGKKILIDGQQRVTALTAAILGRQIVMSDYRKARIRIAFNPIEGRFEVSNPAIEKDAAWFSDIAPIMDGSNGLIGVLREYVERNPGCDERSIENNTERLRRILTKQIGIIDLSNDLDIETVTEIFIRINSKGVALSQADFAMSKIASSEQYGGMVLRKAIDYFCHMAIEPSFHEIVRETDPEFCETDYYRKMEWLKSENDDLYDPDYSDMLRVAFMSEFRRGKLSDLVSLLSGRNFETRSFEASIAKESFSKLSDGILSFSNEYNFRHFVMAIRSAGFVSPGLVRSQSALDFAYVLFLMLRAEGLEISVIQKNVARWFALSILTGRYSGSPESQFDKDIRGIASQGFDAWLADVESAELSDAFWDYSLVQSFDTGVVSTPYLNVFFAAQVKARDHGFLSQDILVEDLIVSLGDLHHVFPKEMLKQKGLQRGQYNQAANFVYAPTDVNIRIGKRSPSDYFNRVKAQCEGGNRTIGTIQSMEVLERNLTMHCIPQEIFDMTADSYQDFLAKRRVLMARKIETYYKAL